MLDLSVIYLQQEEDDEDTPVQQKPPEKIKVV
jgi:hypothetical protein